ncbi:MAG TPA: FAD-dependent oxidoreductase, partial [Saprospiraceae bacterium]|nr:FAD-dependent oxidoreductase [Saprospiraceae bacterium]
MKEVIIIGGGVVGLCCAWHLHDAGLRVTIIDKGDFTDGCSFGNAGMIVPSHFIPLASPGMLKEGIRRMFKSKSPFYIRPRLNADLMQWLWQFLQSANANHVRAVAPILKDLHEESRSIYKTWSALRGFDFDLQENGILMLYQTAKAEKDEIETAEKAHGLGIDAHILNAEQLKAIDPAATFSVRGAVHYTGDAAFSPDVFMKQMITYLTNEGVEFISNTEITSLKDLENKGCKLKSKDGKIFDAKHLVIANGAWSAKLFKSLRVNLPMQGGKGYSMTIEKSGGSPTVPSLLHEARVSLTPMGNRLRIGGTLEISGWDDKIREQKINYILESLPK